VIILRYSAEVLDISEGSERMVVMSRFIMQRKADGRFFVIMRPGSGLGDLTTLDPNKAAIYNHARPLGFLHERKCWRSVKVWVDVTIPG